MVKKGIEGGGRVFEFGEKGRGCLRGEEGVVLGKEVEDVWRQGGIGFMINDDVELGLRVEGEGVDMGQDDGEGEERRGGMGDMIVGV